MNDYFPLGEDKIDDIIEDDGEVIWEDDSPDFIPDEDEIDNTEGSEVL